MKCERWNPIADLAAPLHWRKPRRVELHLDLFGEDRSDEWIAALHGVMAATPQHTYQVLTKRPERAARWFEWVQSEWHKERCSPSYSPRSTQSDIALAAAIGAGVKGGNSGIRVSLSTPPWPLRNVWIGVSVEDQQRADERIHYLLRVPAAVRFLSCEPLLGPVDLSRWLQCLYCYGPEADYHTACTNTGIQWTIVGGESGPGARPCDVSWIRSIVSQCRAAGVPVFVKQLGSTVVARSIFDLGPDVLRWWDSEHAGEPFPERGVRVHLRDRKGGDPSEWPEDLRVREWSEVTP